MKITDVDTFIANPGGDGDVPFAVSKNLCFVKLETDEGIHGWGECYTQADRDLQITAHIDQIAPYLLGRDPANIKHFLQVFYDDYAGRRGAMDYYSAISGLEQAMWDILGKRHGTPTHKLLGGACRSRLRVYANGWSDGVTTPEQLANRAQQTVAQGFSAMKFDPVPGPWRTYISKDVEAQTIDNVRAVRDAVGPEVDLLVEMHRRLSPLHAIRIAAALEEFTPFWYEEPVLAENVDALLEAKSRIRLPIVTGEELYTKFEFRDVFEKRAADIINPDVCNVGGILELKEIAAMAETYFIAVAPHNYNSTTVGLAATLQASATMPNFLITEYFVNLESFGKRIAIEPFEVADGYITLPDRPGLGIDLDEEALRAHPYRPFERRHIRQYHEEGP